MPTIKISDTLGNVHEVPWFTSLRELPYSNKIDFDVAMEDIALWAKQVIESEEQDQKLDSDWQEVSEEMNAFFRDDAYYCYLLCRAISKFTGYDLGKVMQFNTADLVDSHGNLLPHVVAGEKPVVDLDLESTAHTLHQLYAAAKNLVDSYKFEYRTDENFEFVHGSKVWEIPRVIKTLYDKRKVFSKFSTQQAVESLMIRNYLDENINNQPRDKVDGETVENARFSSHLHLIAISLTEVYYDTDGKTESRYTVSLPLDEHDFDTVITERVPLFQDISTQNAMDVIFFLTNISTNSLLARRPNTSSKRPKRMRRTR